jgi:Arc/MetJ-type ribon-helix-helix transcriptional regulator
METITLTLTEEEAALIQELARERGLENAAEVVHALLREMIEASDRLWDEKFANSQDVLDALADEAHAEYIAGLTEDFDPDNDPDSV